MSNAMKRIREDFEIFRRRVARYEEHKNDSTQHRDLCESAYEGLYKLKQRIKKELRVESDLNMEEIDFCHKIFQDKFLDGLLELRTIATHIQSDTAIKKGSLPILLVEGDTLELEVSASSLSVFSENIYVPENQGLNNKSIDHVKNLREAESRISKKLERVCEDT